MSNELFKNHPLSKTTAESRGVQKGREEMESDNKLLREENTKCKDLAWEAANEISRLNKEIERLKSEKLGTVPRMFRCSSTGCTWPNCDCSKLF